MNTIIDKKSESGLFEQTIFINSNDNRKPVKIIDFIADRVNGSYLLFLESLHFKNHPSKISVNNDKLKILIPEPVYLNNNNTSLNKYGWKGNYNLSYFKFKNIVVYLPGSNFYLVKNILIPEKYLLKIELGWNKITHQSKFRSA